jgi:hypothetical protein
MRINSFFGVRIVASVITFACISVISNGQIEKHRLESSEANDLFANESEVSINVYFSSDTDVFPKFKRNVQKHNFDGKVNFYFKDENAIESFDVLGIDIRSAHVILKSDFNWDVSRFNELLSDKSINYKFEQIEPQGSSSDFVYELKKSKDFCQSIIDFDEFFPIVEILLTERSFSKSSIERSVYLNSQDNQKRIGDLSLEIKKISETNEDLKKSLAEIKSSLDNSNNESGKLKIQLSYLPELSNTQLSNQALSAKVLWKIKKSPMSLAFGYGQAGREWKSGTSDYYKQTLSNNGNIPMDIVTQGTNVMDEYSLKFNSALLGLVYDINRLKIGFDFWVPIKSSLTSENISGMFDYYGISNQVLEPIVDIPGLGLASNVSYTGDNFVFQNVVKTRGAVHLGYEMDVLKNMSILPSLYFMSKSTLKNISNAENLTNGYGQYSGLVQYNESERKLSSVLYLNLSVCFKITK